MTLQIPLRRKNALSSATAAMTALLLMSMWIGGPKGFANIIANLMPLFLLITFIALVLGTLLNTQRIRWSVCLGMLSGFAGGTAIIWRVISHF